jgi:mannose-6-phosphate isomerase
VYPLKFREIFKPYFWGGRNLEQIGKSLGQNHVVAESWEIADHGEDVSVVRNGPCAGASLRELIELHGEELCPKTRNGRFPILVKFIDADERVSVQVHPDDEYARTHEGAGEQGKTECWYVMRAAPGARIVMGLKRGITKERLRELAGQNRIDEGLNYVQVRRGDVFNIRSGIVHALLEGIVVCEIQENSDITYRLYDWGRVDREGKPRPLHVEKAFDVIENPPGGGKTSDPLEGIRVSYNLSAADVEVPLVRGPYFNIDRLVLTKDFTLDLAGCSFQALIVLGGSGTIEHEGGSEHVRRGETVLIPGALGSCRIVTGGIELLKIFL